MEKEKKKKKLTLSTSSTSSKKTYNVPNYSKSGQKKSFIIEKKGTRRGNEKRFQTKGLTSNQEKSKVNFLKNNTPIGKGFDLRKIAEERATKRYKNLKEDNLQKKKNTIAKDKRFTSKREKKLTKSKF